MARPVQSQAHEGGLRRCSTGRVCCVLSVSVWWRSAPPLPADRVHLYLTILGQFLPTPSNEKETKLINDGDCGFWLRNIIRGANSCLLLSHQEDFGSRDRRTQTEMTHLNWTEECLHKSLFGRTVEVKIIVTIKIKFAYLIIIASRSVPWYHQHIMWLSDYNFIWSQNVLLLKFLS